MKLVYGMENGKKAILDSNADEAVTSSNYICGREQTRGTDLMLHVTKGGAKIFYLFNWSQWQGEGYSICVLDAETIGVTQWVLENYSALDASEIARLEELGVKIEETA